MRISRFSTANNKEPVEVSGDLADEKMNLEDLVKMVDMEELKKFNPKLHEQIAANPE